jgi:tetratricopeptide (TPR) repeat protein
LSTKLGVLCNRIIEAGWLVALVVTPLFFNVYSRRVFEPDKIAVLRSIALIMGLAWAVSGLEAWRAGAGTCKQKLDRASNPLLFLALLLLATYVFTTVTSVAPRLSLWGSYERLQGLYTTSAYLLIFFSMVRFVRTREQVERLITTVLVVSLPVSLYGIIQHFGTDPIPWDKDVTQRVASTMGNPIFVAAFLIMVVPLTLYRLLEAERTIVAKEGTALKLILVVGSLFNVSLHIAAWWLGPATGSLAAVVVVGIWTVEAVILGKPLLPFVRVSSYSVLLSTQLTCILLSQSRGPWLGLLAGVFCLALLWTVVRGAWRKATAITGLSMALILVLLVGNLPSSPVPFVRHLPYARRLSRVLESGTSRVRMLIWQGAVELVSADPLRAVIGYGPETMLVTYPPYYPPALGQVERRTDLPDRSHNESFDTLVTTGLLGLVLALGFLAGLVFQGLQHLGLVRTPGQRRAFLGLWGMGGLGAVGLLYVIDHTWRFAGVALPLGMLAGLFTYLSGYGFYGHMVGTKLSHAPTPLSLYLFVAAVLAAVVAHVVEIQVGIAIASTHTAFWAWAALLIVAGRVFQERTEGGTNVAVPPAPGRGLVAMSLLVSVVLLTMVFNFLSIPIKPGYLPSVLWLFVFTWTFGGLVTLSETWSSTHGPLKLSHGLKHGGVYAGVTLLGTLLFIAVHQGPLRLWSNPVNSPVLYYSAIALALVVIGGVLLRHERLPQRLLTGVGGLVASGLVVIMVILTILTNLDATRADIYFKQAEVQFHDQGQYDPAIILYRRALALQPKQDFYYLFLGKALLEKGQRVPSAQERAGLFQQAEWALGRARDLNPLHPDHTANLARLYRIWARYPTTAAPRTARLQQALTWYARATTRSPNNVLLWNEKGQIHALMGDNTRARQAYQQALSLDATFGPTYLNLGDVYRTRRQWHEAARAYEQAVACLPNSVQAHSSLGYVLAKMGQLQDAVRANQRVLQLAPNDLGSHRNLALLYRRMGQLQPALTHAQRALDLAPPAQRRMLEKLISQLRQQRRD